MLPGVNKSKDGSRKSLKKIKSTLNDNEENFIFLFNSFEYYKVSYFPLLFNAL